MISSLRLNLYSKAIFYLTYIEGVIIHTKQNSVVPADDMQKTIHS